MPLADLTKDRGAFFGSILGTLNHLLWGDLMWLARFQGSAPPSLPGSESRRMHPTLAAWSAERFRTDGRIRLWAEKLDNVDLRGDLAWHSGMTGRDMRAPMGLTVVHFFNHQTHHRGQVHAMLTAAGSPAPVSDLAFMPDDA
jgi:uncharacterized damage-inducible protein DinB